MKSGLPDFRFIAALFMDRMGASTFDELHGFFKGGWI
jgi:hypothetical protein